DLTTGPSVIQDLRSARVATQPREQPHRRFGHLGDHATSVDTDSIPVWRGSSRGWTMTTMAYWRFNMERLRAARSNNGGSLAERARRAGLKPPALSAIETHHRPCRERSARAVADALGVPLEDIAAPYTAADRPTPRQLPVEVFPTPDDF